MRLIEPSVVIMMMTTIIRIEPIHTGQRIGSGTALSESHAQAAGKL